MIPTNLMYLEQLRDTWKRTLAITVGVALVSALIISGLMNWRNFPKQFVYQLIVSFCVGSQFWVFGPLIRSYTQRMRPGARWAVLIACAAAILNEGVFIGMAVLGVWG